MKKWGIFLIVLCLTGCGCAGKINDRYLNEDALFSKSEIIVLGKTVDEKRNELYNNALYAIQSFSVEEVVKGAVKEDVIQIVCTVCIGDENFSFLKRNSKYVLFLSESNGVVRINENKYLVNGLNYGAFLMKDDKVILHPMQEKDLFSYKGMDKKEFIQTIKDFP